MSSNVSLHGWFWLSSSRLLRDEPRVYWPLRRPHYRLRRSDGRWVGLTGELWDRIADKTVDEHEESLRCEAIVCMDPVADLAKHLLHDMTDLGRWFSVQNLGRWYSKVSELGVLALRRVLNSVMGGQNQLIFRTPC